MSTPASSQQLIELLRKAVQELGYTVNDNDNNLAPKKWLETYVPDLELTYIDKLKKQKLIDTSTIKIVCLNLKHDDQSSNHYFIAQYLPHKKKKAQILLSHNSFPDQEVAAKNILKAPAYTLKPKEKSQTTDKSSFFSLKQQLKKNNPLEMCIAAFMVNTFSLIIPFFISIYFDLIIPNQTSSTLISLSVGVLIMLMFDMLFKKARNHIAERNAIDYEKNLGMLVYDRLFSSPGSFYGFGKSYLRNIPSEIAGLNEVNSSKFILPFFDLIFSIIFIIAIALIGGPIAGVAIICLAFAFINGYRSAKIYMRIEDSRRQAAGLKGNFYNSLISGYEVMSNTLAQHAQRGRYLNMTANVAEVNSALRQRNLQVTTVAQFLGQLQTILILLIGFYMVMDGRLTGGNLFAIMLLSGRLAASFSAFYSLLTLYYRYESTLRTTANALQDDSSKDMSPNLVKTLEHGGVVLNNVMLSLEGRTLLNNIDLVINPGEKVALIGGAGSGKTMLTQVVNGFYKPTSGEVKLSGISMEHIHPSAIASHITYIPREPVLFANSVHANIVSNTELELTNNVIFNELCQFTNKMPNGLTTQIGNDNYHLSFSESRAITLARGLLSPSKMILMDEPDNGLDDNWILHFKNALDSINNKTILATVTNKSLLPHFDRIIILEKGEIVHSMDSKTREKH